jgi:NitT/TauT family transport system substrate-binding protein
MQKGDAQIAEAAEFPVVATAFQKNQLRLIASNDRFENDYLIGRQDRGISAISDLKGKRIGVGLGTITEFYLGRFLALHGMKLQDVTLVDVKPAQFAAR